MLLVCFAAAVGAKYSGGTGEPNNPYQIADVNDLLALAADTGDYNECFILTADIDLDPNLPGRQVFATAVIARDTNSANGFQGAAFTGAFDGAGHKVLNLTIDNNGVRDDYLGLFGDVNGGEIRNLALENIGIAGGNDSNYLGGLVGYNYAGSISNCSSTGNVSAGTPSGPLGGLVGANLYGNISNCFSTGKVTGNYCSQSMGGLVGHTYYGSISDSCSTVDITSGGGSENLGGLAGLAEHSNIGNCSARGTIAGGGNSSSFGGFVGATCDFNTIISNSFSTGDVKPSDGGSSYYFGGFVGQNSGNISNSYSTGSVNAWTNSSFVAGFVAQNSWGHITNCYSTGAVTGGYYLGGLAGYNNGGTIKDCYSTGLVASGQTCGGLIAYNSGTVISSFWDVNTSGRATSAGGTGKTTTEIKTKSTFTNAGWDFNDLWAICENTNYPRLQWQIPAADLVCPDGVTFLDYSFFSTWWGRDDCAINDDCDGADIDFSGTVDIADLDVMCNYWLEGTTN